MERLSLAQQIAQLEDVAPVDVDPEDVEVTGIDLDPSIQVDQSAARAHYFTVGPSSLRKLHDSLSDPKYDGAKTSRELMLGEESESSSVSEDAGSDSDVSEHLVTESREKRKADTRTTMDAPTERPGELTQSGDLASTLRRTREEDRKKGKAISRQIALWDSLLDARIRLQKSVAGGNRLPPLSQIVDDEQVHNAVVKMLEEARLLSDEIFGFQERLLSANESIQPPPRKRRKSTESGYSVVDYTEELREASHVAAGLECAYHAHLVQTLNKWSSKIQAVTPSVLLPSNRNAFSRTTHHIKSAPQLIDETLADHGKVVARTRMYRGKESRVGDGMDENEGREKEDPEVFDDTDFYYQLLRDVIDARGNGAGEDWMAVQREKRARKKVDTKASKGRKLRYQVHEKMQNFMVPVLVQGGWHEEQIDELFGSLLGKGFEDEGIRVFG